ncbi:MAG: hypothetical protein IKY02_05155 [Lachnospiraceae bacterium]|nr:hypothetical protein [Lachnospiraceae bacterium]
MLLKKLCSYAAAAFLCICLVSCGTVFPGTEAPTVPSETPASSAEEPTAGTPSEETTAEETPAPRFLVGFGRREIMPEDSVIMSNYGVNRWSDGYNNLMYANVIALTDELGTTLLLIDLDTATVPDNMISSIKKELKSAYGIPADMIRISNTHNHAAVDLTKSSETNNRYVKQLTDWILEAAEDAINSRTPSSIEIGTSIVESMNFVRHYITVDGDLLGDNYISTPSIPECASHVDEPDKTLQVIRFVRENAKDLILVGWRAHNHLGAGATITKLQGGYPVAMVESLEKKLDCNAVFYQLDAGRINAHSRIKSEMLYEDIFSYGEALADRVIETLERMEPIESGPIRSLTTTWRGKIHHDQPIIVSIALKVYTEWQKGEMNSTEARRMCIEENEKMNLSYHDGVHSVFHAMKVYGRTALQANGKTTLNAYAIGDSLAFTFDSYEMFDENGRYIRENSPFKMTLTVSYSDPNINDQSGYVPSIEAFNYGCYEADCCSWEPGAGEALAETFVEMLKQLKEQASAR